MMSLFNPWVILGILIAIGSAFGGGYSKGKHDEFAKQQMEIAALNQKSRETEQKMAEEANDLALKLKKAENDAKTVSQKRNSAIDTGTLKLRIPVKTPVCPVSTPTDTESSTRPNTSTAELQPEIAKSLIAITDDADNTARRLNACIAIYNQVREMINEKK